MLRFLSRWRPRALFLAWIAYWLALVLVELTPAFIAIWQATHAGPGQGDINVSAGTAGVRLVVTLGGKVLWEGARSVLGLALMIAGPPLALFALWVSQRPRDVPAGVSRAHCAAERD